jgi:hypothetical protein
MVIEREAGERREADINTARKLVARQLAAAGSARAAGSPARPQRTRTAKRGRRR